MPPRPPRMLDLDEMREKARRLRAEADQIEGAIQVLEAQRPTEEPELLMPEDAAPVRRTEPIEVPVSHSLLPSAKHSVTNDDTMATPFVTPAIESRQTGRPIRSKSPVQDTARTLGITVKQLSELVGAKYQTMRQWGSRGPVPDDIKDRFAELIAAHRASQKPKKSRS